MTPNECIKTCVNKIKSGDRNVNGVTISSAKPGADGKVSCYCESKMTGPNTSTSWKTCQMDKSGMKENGKFTEWTKWTKCSKSCNKGVSKRERSCTNPAPKNGGTECVGETEESKDCNTETCPAVDCNFVMGDGTGGSEKYIGSMTPNECIKTCAINRKQDKDINGCTISSATPAADGKVSCYCEKKMTGPNTSTSWKTCKMVELEEKADTAVCVFGIGDGVGGAEEYIGQKKNEKECIDTCKAKRRAGDSSINGVTVSTAVTHGTIYCYCEKQMKSRNTKGTWKTCFI